MCATAEMVASDDDYVEGDDDIQLPGVRSRSARGATSRAAARDSNFALTKTWENLEEGADGTITGAVEGLQAAEKRKR